MCADATINKLLHTFRTKLSQRYDTLKTLKMIKTNASSVISNLGAGQHGHRGLVVPDAEYNQITGYTYTKLTHPG